MGASRIKQVGIYVGKHFRLFKNEKGWKTIVFAAMGNATFSITSVEENSERSSPL